MELMNVVDVHENGDVCISILHPPGDDKYGYEDARYLIILNISYLGIYYFKSI